MASAPDGFQALHRYNRFGFRGPDFSVRPHVAFRIASIGDSFTEGLGAREDESWPSALQARLSDLDCEVLNLGAAGASPEHYGRMLCEAALPLGPTDVVVCLLPSDLRRGPKLPYGSEQSWNLPAQPRLQDPFIVCRSPASKPFAYVLPGWTYLLDRARGRWPIQKGLYWEAWSDRHLRLAADHLRQLQDLPHEQALELVRQRLSLIEPRVLEASAAGQYSPLAIAVTLADPLFFYALKVDDMRIPPEFVRAFTELWIRWYAYACSSHGVRPWLVYFPEACLVCKGLWGPLREDKYDSPPRIYGDTSARDLLQELCTRHRVRFLDAMPVLLRHNRERLYHRYDTHPTARCYGLVGEVVAAELRRDLQARRAAASASRAQNSRGMQHR
jgi:hypothetical protein